MEIIASYKKIKWPGIKSFIREDVVTLSLSILLWIISLLFIYMLCRHFV